MNSDIIDNREGQLEEEITSDTIVHMSNKMSQDRQNAFIKKVTHDFAQFIIKDDRALGDKKYLNPNHIYVVYEESSFLDNTYKWQILLGRPHTSRIVAPETALHLVTNAVSVPIWVFGPLTDICIAHITQCLSEALSAVVANALTDYGSMRLFLLDQQQLAKTKKLLETYC